MFGWRKKHSGPTEAKLRETTLRRLAEVLAWPEESVEASEPSQQIPSKREQLELNTQPKLSRAY